jgi:hypothetical protein
MTIAAMPSATLSRRDADWGAARCRRNSTVPLAPVRPAGPRSSCAALSSVSVTVCSALQLGSERIGRGSRIERRNCEDQPQRHISDRMAAQPACRYRVGSHSILPFRFDGPRTATASRASA